MAHAHRVLVDECLSPRVVHYLNQAGFDAVRVPRAGQQDSPDDEEVMARAVQEGRIVATADQRDYRHIHTDYQKRGLYHHGILLVKLLWRPDGHCQALDYTLSNTSPDMLVNQLVRAGSVIAGPPPTP